MFLILTLISCRERLKPNTRQNFEIVTFFIFLKYEDEIRNCNQQKKYSQIVDKSGILNKNICGKMWKKFNFVNYPKKKKQLQPKYLIQKIHMFNNVLEFNFTCAHVRTTSFQEDI